MLEETIKKVGNKFIVYPKKGGKRLGTHNSLASAKKQLRAIEMSKHEDQMPGGLGDGKSLSDIAKKHNVPKQQIKKQLKMGVKVEMEHTNDPSHAAEIALDHLVEDPLYYTKLKKMETEGLEDACWKGYQAVGMKLKNGKKVPNCVPIRDSYDVFCEDTGVGYTLEFVRDNSLTEAEYQGRKVSLGKPMQGDVKKFKVYVKNDKGNVVKVNFGDPNMRIKKSNPERRKSFRARHKCSTPGPRWKARYWSCKKW